VKLRFGDSMANYRNFLAKLWGAYASLARKNGNYDAVGNCPPVLKTGGRDTAVNRLEFQNGSAHVCSHR